MTALRYSPDEANLSAAPIDPKPIREPNANLASRANRAEMEFHHSEALTARGHFMGLSTDADPSPQALLDLQWEAALRGALGGEETLLRELIRFCRAQPPSFRAGISEARESEKESKKTAETLAKRLGPWHKPASPFSRRFSRLRSRSPHVQARPKNRQRRAPRGPQGHAQGDGRAAQIDAAESLRVPNRREQAV